MLKIRRFLEYHQCCSCGYEFLSQNVMKINNKEYIKSGDLGYIDEDGFIYIKGRKKRVFKISGINVYPLEIEKIVLEKEEINLNLMLEQIADDFYPTLKEMNKKINFTSDEKTILYADPDKLSRVFNNLIKNAVNYSKENTDIDISILNKENQATVKITNKGKQIPKEKLDKIFEKFYSCDKSHTDKTHCGLGLSIALDLLYICHGDIQISDNPEGGSIFTIFFSK